MRSFPEPVRLPPGSPAARRLDFFDRRHCVARGGRAHRQLAALFVFLAVVYVAAAFLVGYQHRPEWLALLAFFVAQTASELVVLGRRIRLDPWIRAEAEREEGAAPDQA